MENEDVTRSNDQERNSDIQMIAHSDFSTHDKSQLSFKKGDTLVILDQTNQFWWWAELDGNYGFVPVNHLCKDEEWASAGWQDEEYFGSYGDLKLHHEMLSDKARTKAYLDAIVNNSTELEGKTGLDIGCGTGILSMMCAKYGGMEKVYAVEVSEMAEHTHQVIKQNNLSHKIEVKQDYAENLDLDQPVDIIVSEWMGTVLLVIRDMAKTQMLKKPLYDYVLPKEDCLSIEQCVLKLDMNSVTVEQLEENVSEFKFIVKCDGMLHGFCTWFEVGFSPLSDHLEEVRLNTGPDHELTHWKQDLFMLDEPFKMWAGNVVGGTFTLVRNTEWRRHLRVHIEYRVLDNHTSGKQILQGAKLFHVWR